MTLRVHTPPGPRLARLPFPAPLTGPDQARPVLIELLQAARTALAGPSPAAPESRPEDPPPRSWQALSKGPYARPAGGSSLGGRAPGGGWFGAGAVDSRLHLCKRVHIGLAARGEIAPAFEARRWTGSRTVNPPRSLETELGCRCRMT